MQNWGNNQGECETKTEMIKWKLLRFHLLDLEPWIQWNKIKFVQDY